MHAQEGTKKHFLTLDGARGVAALFVAIFHTEPFWRPIHFAHSYLAVDLFFVLSGFVIAYAYDAKLLDGRMSAKKFMLVRLIRLYPMYFIATMLAVAGFAIQGKTDPDRLWPAAALAFALLPASLPGSIFLFPFNHPCWSVFFELISNATYAVNRSRLIGRWLLVSIVVLGVGVVTLAVLKNGVNEGFAFSAASIASGTMRACFGLFFGILIYHHRDRLAARWQVPAVVVIAVIAGTFAVPLLGPVNGGFDSLCLCVLFPACVLFGARASSGPLLSRIFGFVGRPSYTIYLIHVPVSFWVLGLAGRWVEPYAPFSGIALFALIFLLAWLLEPRMAAGAAARRTDQEVAAQSARAPWRRQSLTGDLGRSGRSRVAERHDPR